MARQVNETTSLGKANSYGAVSSNDTVVNSTRKTKQPRVVALDVFRGLLMVIQSLDHAKDFMSSEFRVIETWYLQQDFVPPITRLVTHLSAPGFTFLMGFGIILFSKSRLEIGWNTTKLLKHYISRGLILIILNTNPYFQAYSNVKSAFYVISVLFALGINFILGVLIFLAGIKSFPYLLKFYQKSSVSNPEKKSKYTRNIILLIIIILLAVGNVLQTPKSAEYGKIDFGLWRYIWLLPGCYKFIYSFYPPINWLSFTIHGILYGHITLKKVYDRRYNRNLNVKIGIFLLTLFLAIRIPGRFGNINPELLPPPPPGTLFNNPYLTSPLQFINAIKYPPDLSFISLYMGLNHLVLAFFYSIPLSTSYSILNYFIDFINHGPLLAFGQSSLFFYMVHFHLYLFMGSLFKFFFGYLYNIHSWQFWSWWIFGLALLWPICAKYSRFKSSKDPNSLWRFF